jgi:ABC-2 type transport system permease protein
MRLEVIWASFFTDLKSFIRSKATLFWTLLFPVMLILMFGAIFSGVGDAEYDLVIVDFDNSITSKTFVNILNNTPVIKTDLRDVSKDNILQFIKDENIKRLVVIPEGFQQAINDKAVTNISFYFDQSEQQSNSI